MKNRPIYRGSEYKKPEKNELRRWMENCTQHWVRCREQRAPVAHVDHQLRLRINYSWWLHEVEVIISLKSCEVQVSGVWAVPMHKLVSNPSWWLGATVPHVPSRQVPLGGWVTDFPIYCPLIPPLVLVVHNLAACWRLPWGHDIGRPDTALLCYLPSWVRSPCGLIIYQCIPGGTLHSPEWLYILWTP